MSSRRKPEADNCMQSCPDQSERATIAINPSGIDQHFKSGHSRYAGMAFIPHWIPACAGMTARVIPASAGMAARGDAGLRRAATGLLGGLFPTPLYRLHPCRRAFAGMTAASSTLAQAFLGVLHERRQEIFNHPPGAELDLHRHGHAGAEIDLGVADPQF